MAAPFDAWEKDPLFSAAEEVQASADRMESVYRLWIQERNFASNPSPNLSQDLKTALGTAKWQLEELQRAVRLNNEELSVGKSTKSRRAQFISAIGSQILIVENSLKECNLSEGEKSLSWVRLNEGERDELALFLSGSDQEQEKVVDLPPFDPLKSQAASADPDNEALKISVSSEDDNSQKLLEEQSNFLPPRMPSFSWPTSSHSSSKINWYLNGFRKWRGGRGCDVSIPLQDQQLNRRVNACYEGSKSCLSSCGDETCEKQLNGWVGAIQRRLQRSQYQIQYGRPVQIIMWAIFAVLLIGELLLPIYVGPSYMLFY